MRGPLSSSETASVCVGQAARDQRQPARRGVGLDRLGLQARLGELLREQPREIGARLVLHPRRDFLGEEFEQEISHTIVIPAEAGMPRLLQPERDERQ